MSKISLSYCKYCHHAERSESKGLICTLNPEYQLFERECPYFERDDTRVRHYHDFNRDLSDSTGTGFQSYLPWFRFIKRKQTVVIKDSWFKVTMVLGLLIASLVFIGLSTDAFATNKIMNIALLIVAFGIELALIIKSTVVALKGNPNLQLSPHGIQVKDTIYPWSVYVGRQIEKEHIGIPSWFNRPIFYMNLFFIGKEKPIRIKISFQNYSPYTVVYLIDTFNRKYTHGSK